MRGFWVQIALIAALLLVALLVWRRLSVQRAQRAALVRVGDRCSSPGAGAQATILLLIATHGNAAAAARAIHSAFDKASCPFRVFVALHETADVPADVYDDPSRMRAVVAAATPTMALYADAARHGTYGRSFADQVRALCVPVARSYGTHAARAALMAAAYRGQTYVATLSDAATLTQGWDAAAIAALTATKDPHALLTAPPALPFAPVLGPARGRNGAQRDAWDVAAASFLHPSSSSSSSSAAEELGPALGRFPIFLRFSKAGLPVVGSRTWGRPPSTPIPSLFWTGDCTFAPARAYLEADVPSIPAAAPFDARLACLTAGEDGIMSARLWSAGWAFYAPPAPIAAYQDGVDAAATPDADKAAILGDRAKMQSAAATHAAARSLLESLPTWQAHAGVDVRRQIGSGRARMGSLPAPSAEEVVAKFDSKAAYHAEVGVYRHGGKGQ